ncbi:MAG: helix-turn-helix domain-containing protein [Cyanobacteria bacterium P01_E01_bin.6]
MGDRVRSQLQTELNGGIPTAETIAHSLSMSVRSLHRSLKNEGTSFQSLLDHVRHEQAVTLLANARTSIAEIAFLLEFAEVSSFPERSWSSHLAYRSGYC